MNYSSSDKPINLAEPILGDDEKIATQRVINSRWLTMGQEVSRFEEQFAKEHDQNEAAAVSSCTAGLHLALQALGIGLNDEVLVPSLTFVATANVVRYCGATPVFVDIESVDRPHISIEDAQKKLSANTKAVIVMHYAGYPVDMNSWRKFADEHGLYLIEDAAHAPGAKGVGKLSDATAFSFFSNKNMTTGEGGMVFMPNSENLNRVKLLRAHGMTQSTLERDKGHAFSYDVIGLGNNYRLDEIRGAIGQVQLSKLSQWNQKRAELITLYREKVRDLVPEINLTFGDNDYTVGHLFTVLLPDNVDRNSVMNSLRSSGIQSSIHYPPIHRFSAYSHTNQTPLDNTEQYSNRTLTLPLHPLLTENDVDRVVRGLKIAL